MSVSGFLHQNKFDLVAILTVHMLVATPIILTILVQSRDLQIWQPSDKLGTVLRTLSKTMAISAHCVNFCAKLVK